MTQKGSIFMEKTYTSCRKDYPVFYYTHYEVHETASDLAVTYHFEIPGLSSFAPTWCFPKKAEDCTCWSEDPTLLRTIFSLNRLKIQPESQTYFLSQVLLWRQIRLLLTAAA